MKRRDCLAALAFGPAAHAAPGGTIQLHVDLEADPAHEEELLRVFRNQFRPAISRQPGFVEVRLLKRRAVVAGAQPSGAFQYRLLIGFRTEEQRQAWVATPEHQKVWPAIERTLRGAGYSAVLYDAV